MKHVVNTWTPDSLLKIRDAGVKSVITPKGITLPVEQNMRGQWVIAGSALVDIYDACYFLNNVRAFAAWNDSDQKGA
jgi:hypothetical protein